MQTTQTNQYEMEREPRLGHERGRSSVVGMVMKTRCSIAALVAVMVGMPFSSMADIRSVVFQAESGALGADFIVGNSSGVIYISNTNNIIGFGSIRPQIPRRVASYSVTIPSVGTYELYARVRVGPGGPNDDSFYYGNGFGRKQETTIGDWVRVDGVNVRGFANPTDVVTDGGSAGTNVWKWINLSQDTGASGLLPNTFTVLGNLTQTFQIGGREDGLDLDKFVFSKVGYPLTVADLDAVTTPVLLEGQVSAPTFLNNGTFSISYAGTSGYDYVAEWTDNLIPPVTWTPMVTNTADSIGLVQFTNSPAGSRKYYRVHSDSATPPPVPLVYAVENTGAKYPAPPLPTIANLPTIQPLPDPFAWANDPYGGTRSTAFSDWEHHRAEMKAQIENYEIGTKPAVDPTNIFASYSGSTLTVRVTNNNQTLTLTCAISLPSESGPFPAVIGMNNPSGSIPSSLFTSRNIARITFSHNQVTTYGNPQNTNPYYQLYPALNIDNTGQYSAWAWGVSRIIDGLQLVTNTLPIDLKHLAVTGCSYAGKMALFAGAFDERIALTIAQESGGGGATSWRYSHTETDVESLENTDHNWFRESMFQFGGNNVSKLPVDHHELMAMCAPRALFVTANPDYLWLSNPSCYVCSRATQQIYETLGIPDRFGFSIVGGHTHCALPDSQTPEVGAFLDKFLLGNTNANTYITTNPYAGVDYARWSAWWGTTNPVFPGTLGDTYTITFEAECGTVGTNWDILTDAQASNGSYVTVKPSLQSLSTAPTGSQDLITVPFSLTNNGNYAVFGRLNCPTAEDDSFWVKLDDGAFVMRNGLRTSGWQWLTLNSYTLAAGPHTLTIGYREDGALLDKILVSDYQFSPSGMGEPAQILCP